MTRSRISTPSRVFSGITLVGYLVAFVAAGQSVIGAWPEGIAAWVLGVGMAISFVRYLLENFVRAWYGANIWDDTP